MADARKIIDSSPLHPLQIAAIATTVGLNALDGFDVLSISFASPGIAKEWGIDKAALGAVLSMELIGMALGSVLLGGVADKIGRRPTILGCLVVMAIGMFGAMNAHDVTTLSIWRVLTGLGIGGMLASINAVAAEFTNAVRKNFALAIMVIGYPIGAVIGGTVAAILLKGGDWRQVFEFGAIVTLTFIPLVFWLIPESPSFLATQGKAGALDKINATLARWGHTAATDMVAAPAQQGAKPSVLDILKPGLLPTTLLLTFAYFAHCITFYFVLKWVPKIVVDMGYAPSSAAGVLVWTNVGGAVGGAIFGLLAQRFAVKRMTIIALVLSTVMVTVFGHGYSTVSQLAMVACISGLFTNSAIVGLYSIFARGFPTHVRATGTGFAIGMGRGGSALAPYAGGLLFQAHVGLQNVAMIMALGSLAAALALSFVKFADAKH